MTASITFWWVKVSPINLIYVCMYLPTICLLNSLSNLFIYLPIHPSSYQVSQLSIFFLNISLLSAFSGQSTFKICCCYEWLGKLLRMKVRALEALEHFGERYSCLTHKINQQNFEIVWRQLQPLCCCIVCLELVR